MNKSRYLLMELFAKLIPNNFIISFENQADEKFDY